MLFSNYIMKSGIIAYCTLVLLVLQMKFNVVNGGSLAHMRCRPAGVGAMHVVNNYPRISQP